ncbi:MAG: signal peptidase I [Candidatus Eisenbacteria bacterium]
MADRPRGRAKMPAAPKRNRAREYGEAIFVAGVLFFFLRTFVIQAFQIPTGSMEDTLLVGDFLVANKFLYGARIPFTETRLPAVREPKAGDIIVFRAPHVDKDYIKRCVAVEGETVELRNNVLYVNGEAREEPFTVLKGGGIPAMANWGPKVVPENALLMLGDNRNQSQDSRYWGFLDKSRVKGHAMFLYFSWDKDRFLPRITRFLRPIH